MTSKTKKFLAKLKELGLYNEELHDYSKVNYIDDETPIIIIDKGNEYWYSVVPKKIFSQKKVSYHIKNDRYFYPFNEAKVLLKSHNIKTTKEYLKYIKENKLNLPTEPHKVYKNDGWKGMADYLQNGKDKESYPPFVDAKKILKPYGIQTAKEYQKCIKKNKLNLPTRPHEVYDEDWISYGDYLGYIGNGNHKWLKKYLLSYLSDLNTELNSLEAVELLTIINSNNLNFKLKQIGKLDKLLSTSPHSKQRDDSIKDIIHTIETDNKFDDIKENNIIYNDDILNDLIKNEDVSVNDTDINDLPQFDIIEDLKYLDNDQIISSLDDANIDFLMKNSLKRIWNSILNGTIDPIDFLKQKGGKNFKTIQKLFKTEYYSIKSIKTPNGYIFPNEPNLMQKLITYRLAKEKRYGNWSGTGSGKTLSAIFAGRNLKAKNTLIICNNSMVEGWVNSIHEYFTNSNVFTKLKLQNTPPSYYSVIDKNSIKINIKGFNYLVLNYETFQQNDGENVALEIINNNMIDYIILDEVQNVKQRDDNKSIRKDTIEKLLVEAQKKNENLYRLVMTATPVINNLYEAKKLIELLTGYVHDDLNTTDSVINGIEIYKYLTRYGLRYIPKYDIGVNEEIISINGNHLVDKLIGVKAHQVNVFEKILIKTKLDGIKDKITKGTLIYTHYIDSIVPQIKAFVEKMGLRVGLYIGSDKSGLELFKKGKVDVLIGSSPVTTGVDGIQKICNNLIPIVLTWTSAEYNQLKGRLIRQGSIFEKVNIFIPQIEIKLDNGTWSWDKRKFEIVRYKATLTDLAVDGKIPNNLTPPMTKLMDEAQEELRNWIERIQNGNTKSVNRIKLETRLEAKELKNRKQYIGDFSELNRNWSVAKSTTLNERLLSDPSEWYHYHKLYREKRKSWSEQPYKVIANELKKRKDWIIGDFGCGENLLSLELPNKIYAFDHIAIDDDVVSCDITNVPLDDESLDVAVYSLSLMGTNYKDYLKEAYRVLKHYGTIRIAEPQNKWKDKLDNLINCLTELGFNVIKKEIKHKFIYINAFKD